MTDHHAHHDTDLGAICDLAASGIEVDGQVQVTESTWVVYGYTAYDGEVIVGEYHRAAEATAAYRAAAGYTGPGPGPGDGDAVAGLGGDDGGGPSCR